MIKDLSEKIYCVEIFLLGIEYTMKLVTSQMIEITTNLHFKTCIKLP